MQSLLTRTLSLKSYGDDVYGATRAVLRLLDAGDGGQRLKALEKKSPLVKRSYGVPRRTLVNKARRAMGFAATGKIDQPFWAALVKGGWPDARSIELMNQYIDGHPHRAVVFPVPLGQMATVCQRWHETAGISGSWAFDFCCYPGTTIVAVEDGVITKLSGHNPNDDTWDSQGVFGWSVHFRTQEGYRYYVTHLGYRLPSLQERMHVAAGDTLGRVGDQKFRPDHVHVSVQSPFSEADAKKRIAAVAAAPRID